MDDVIGPPHRIGHMLGPSALPRSYFFSHVAGYMSVSIYQDIKDWAKQEKTEMKKNKTDNDFLESYCQERGLIWRIGSFKQLMVALKS